MADFTTTMSDSSVIDTEITIELQTEFEVAFGQANVMDPFVQFNRQIAAKSIAFPIFNRLAVATTALTEKEDVASVAMGDSEVLLTPAEYGNVVTPTKLADLQTGGRAALAAVQLAGINMGETRNALAIAALEAGSNLRRVDGVANDGLITAAKVLDADELDYIYNRMSRANVPKHPLTGTFVAFLHDDVAHDLRAGSAAGTWVDVNKYNNEMPVLNNEIGMYKGFRIVINNHCNMDANVGDGSTVDVYDSTFIGHNALGLAESAVPSLVISGPFDKLQRFMNVGWYGCFKYSIIQSDAVWRVRSASSVGANT